MIDYYKLSNQLRAHVENSEHNLDAKRISLDAIDGFTRVFSSGDLTMGNLFPIIVAVKNEHTGPYYIGTELFLVLLSQYPAMKEVLTSLISSKSAHERWIALSLIRDERIPDDIAFTIVKAGIHDTSAKVRSFAVECVYSRSITQFLGELIDMTKNEKNVKVLNLLEWVIERMK